MNSQPRGMIFTAVILLLAGAILPFLMIIGVLESTFFMNFLTYIASVIGMFVGFLGIAMWVGDERRQNDDWHDYE